MEILKNEVLDQTAVNQVVQSDLANEVAPKMKTLEASLSGGEEKPSKKLLKGTGMSVDGWEIVGGGCDALGRGGAHSPRNQKRSALPSRGTW